MRLATAAAYLDVSETTFADRVAVGLYPPGVLDIGIRVWLRDDLDALIDRQFNVAAQAELDAVDPFAAPVERGKRSTLATV